MVVPEPVQTVAAVAAAVPPTLVGLTVIIVAGELDAEPHAPLLTIA